MKLPKELTTITKVSKSLALITFFILPVIGFFAGIRYQSFIDYQIEKNQLSNDQVPSLHLTEEKMYSNKTYKISFNYPRSWKYSEMTGKITPDIFWIMFNPDDSTQYTSGNINVNIEKYNGTIEDYIKQRLCIEASCKEPNDTLIFTTNLFKGKKIISPGPVPAENVIFLNNGFIYRFFIFDPFYNTSTTQQIDANREILNKMLTSVHFL